MNQMATLDTSASEVTERQASIARYPTEVDRMREQMSRDQGEIDRSRKRTRALLTEAKAALSHLDGRRPERCERQRQEPLSVR